MPNLLSALVNIIENPINDLISYYKGKNRVNNMGEALETYVKDAFFISFDKSEQEKNIFYSNNFSYLGNQNNPPDIIIKNGDAIEVKKIESLKSAIALNSSYPKNKLYADDSRITVACKSSDGGDWKKKDIIYVVGAAPSSKLKSLWFVYGDCYAADKEVYQRISNKISNGIKEIPDVELIKTNELAKVKKVDPLGITDLRVRGMWHIENPIKVFSEYNNTLSKETKFSINAILLQEKYLSFPEADRKKIETKQNKNFIIKDIQIKSPNNPAQLLKAKLISYEK